LQNFSIKFNRIHRSTTYYLHSRSLITTRFCCRKKWRSRMSIFMVWDFLWQSKKWLYRYFATKWSTRRISCSTKSSTKFIKWSRTCRYDDLSQNKHSKITDISDAMRSS